MLEKIMAEIRDELKRSNDLKEKHFTNTAEEPAGWTQLPAKEEPKQEEPKQDEVPDESEMKKAVAKIIKGTDNEKKTKLKTKINEIGAKKVSDIQPEQRQTIIDYVAELDND